MCEILPSGVAINRKHTKVFFILILCVASCHIFSHLCANSLQAELNLRSYYIVNRPHFRNIGSEHLPHCRNCHSGHHPSAPHGFHSTIPALSLVRCTIRGLWNRSSRLTNLCWFADSLQKMQSGCFT